MNTGGDIFPDSPLFRERLLCRLAYSLRSLAREFALRTTMTKREWAGHYLKYTELNDRLPEAFRRIVPDSRHWLNKTPWTGPTPKRLPNHYSLRTYLHLCQCPETRIHNHQPQFSLGHPCSHLTGRAILPTPSFSNDWRKNNVRNLDTRVIDAFIKQTITRKIVTLVSIRTRP